MQKEVSTSGVRIGTANTLALIVGSLLGLLASVGLLETELAHIRNPDAALGCDLNSLISCGSSLMSPQAHLLGVPNSALGIGAFGALLAVGVFALLGTRFSVLSVRLLGLGGVGGLGFVAFFLHASATNFFALCPYCMVVWSGAIIVAAVLIPTALLTFEAPRDTAATCLRYSWAVMVSLHLVVFLVVLLTMSEQIGGLF
ncbi:MAG: vitamin K epoxide reductase family protein [Actinomycetaceae bacterium]|nr:vitamin K epoxide reductase family protein [Actinomycetaceae bacterium]